MMVTQLGWRWWHNWGEDYDDDDDDDNDNDDDDSDGGGGGDGGGCDYSQLSLADTPL